MFQGGAGEQTVSVSVSVGAPADLTAQNDPGEVSHWRRSFWSAQVRRGSVWWNLFICRCIFHSIPQTQTVVPQMGQADVVWPHFHLGCVSRLHLQQLGLLDSLTMHPIIKNSKSQCICWFVTDEFLHVYCSKLVLCCQKEHSSGTDSSICYSRWRKAMFLVPVKRKKKKGCFYNVTPLPPSTGTTASVLKPFFFFFL